MKKVFSLTQKWLNYKNSDYIHELQGNLKID